MARATSNNAPKCKWHSVTMACGTVRQRLYVDGIETPYFVDSASTLAHRTQGETHGLFGSGMGDEVRRRDGSSYRIAAMLAASARVTPLKMKAEQFALA